MGLKTKEELACDQLKLLILSGELPKNEFLSQRMLASRVGTNITTVRTALRQLESDGLLENVPQWGVRIPVETEEGLRDLYFMRTVLETAAVRRLVHRRDSIDTEALMRKAEHCDSLDRQLPRNLLEFSQAHFDFHLELAKQSGSELLVQSLNRIHFRSRLLQHDQRLWKRHRTVNHGKLLETIFSSSADEAADAIEAHITEGLKHELEMLGSTDGSGAAA